MVNGMLAASPNPDSFHLESADVSVNEENKNKSTIDLNDVAVKVDVRSSLIGSARKEATTI